MMACGVTGVALRFFIYLYIACVMCCVPWVTIISFKYSFSWCIFFFSLPWSAYAVVLCRHLRECVFYAFQQRYPLNTNNELNPLAKPVMSPSRANA